MREKKVPWALLRPYGSAGRRQGNAAPLIPGSFNLSNSVKNRPEGKVLA